LNCQLAAQTVRAQGDGRKICHPRFSRVFGLPLDPFLIQCSGVILENHWGIISVISVIFRGISLRNVFLQQ